MEKQVYNFSEFSYQNAELAFQLEKDKEPTLMEVWNNLAKQQTINDKEKDVIEENVERLKEAQSTWNEQELQTKFIAPLLWVVKFDMLKYGFASFSERWLKKQIGTATFQGKVDWMVASGKYDPIKPFFFIHEYKRGVEASGDATGQLLATMCIAQALNNTPSKPTLFNPKPMVHNDLPIYGCYIIGQWWHFVVLKNKQYYISEPYDAVKKTDLTMIVKLLKAQKEMILEYVRA